MKIIRSGDLNNLKRIKRFECDNCGCIFEADNNEYRLADAIENIHDGIVAKCKCPCCKQMVYLHK